MEKFIPISQPSITKKEIEYVTDAISSGWVSSLGKYIDIFEEKFASYCNTKYALTTSNGTAALHLALVSIGINKNDEVIIPDFTFIATANVVTYTGANPVTVDIEKDSLCINPEKIKKAITSNTKAIIPVHIYGHPCDMDAINKIAKQHNLYVIEDAAEAHGAEYKNRKVGSLGDIGCFSFYGNKIITTGEGGMITTNNKKIYERAKFLRDHAMSKDKRYWHMEVGYNYRMTNLQAALGVAQLERIEELIEKKREIFNWYKEGLKDIKNIKLNFSKENVKNVYWIICVEIENYIEKQRDNLLTTLKEKGIDGRPFFYPISDMPMYKKNDTPITHKIFERGFNLPSYFDLTKKEVEYICKIIKKELI